MIELVIHAIVVLLIVGVLWWALTAALGLIPLDAKIAQLVNILLIVLLALIIIYYALLPLLHISTRGL